MNEDKPRLLDNPIVGPGCYTLHLYCKYSHGYSDYHEGISGAEIQTYRQAKREANRLGWIIHPDGTATCGHHAKALKGRL